MGSSSSTPSEPAEETLANEPELKTFSSSCLTEAGPDGQPQLLDLAPHKTAGMVGTGEHVVSLRHGLFDARVVLKPVPVRLWPPWQPQQTHRVTGPPQNVQEHPHVLRPFVWIEVEGEHGRTASSGGGSFMLAYIHSRHGCLAEWAEEREAAGQPVRAAEAARIVQCVVSAWTSFWIDGLVAAINAIRADEIFIDEEERPLVRKPLPGKPAGWGDELKWWSPDEATGNVDSNSDGWPAVSFRLGLLLYCLGSCRFGDPYPNKTGEAVLMGLLAEVRGSGPPLRPDMDAYRGPDILQRLVSACLRLGGQAPPAWNVMESVLQAVAGAGRM